MKQSVNYLNCSLLCILLFVLSTSCLAGLSLYRTLSETNFYGSSAFGRVITAAGDVNGDGQMDMAVSAPNYDNNAGRVYIFFGGAAVDTIPDIILENGTYESFGSFVAGVGDINNDNYDDLLVSTSGQVLLYLGGTVIDILPDMVFDDETAAWSYGSYVTAAGDVNDDGFADFLIGDYGFELNTGQVFLYLGGNTVDTQADAVFAGHTINGAFGKTLSSAGDVNNDGFSDILIGTGFERLAYLYLGAAQIDTTADLVLNGEGSGGSFGKGLASAGDVNLDGYDDILVGDGSYDSRGRAYIFYGDSLMDDTADVILNSEQINSQFGAFVGNAGDVNNDGFNDVMVGASLFDTGEGEQGRVYLFFGGAQMDSLPDVHFDGEPGEQWMGKAMTGVGDINGDGIDDLLLGHDAFGIWTGRCYVHFGSISMDDQPDLILHGEGISNWFGLYLSFAGDLNNDGFDDIMVAAPSYKAARGQVYIYFGSAEMDTIADIKLIGPNPGINFGSSIASAGDINNDGFDDIVIGAWNYQRQLGRCYIFFGGNPMDKIPDVTITGWEDEQQFGFKVAGVGDVNNDNYDDIMVGDYYTNFRETGAFLFYGGSAMDTIPDVEFRTRGEMFYNLSFSGAGDVNNDAYDDILFGIDKPDAHETAVYLFLGSASMDTTIDLTFQRPSIEGIIGDVVSSAGDINNDGYDDFLIGNQTYANNLGGVLVFHGSASPDTSVDLLLRGEYASSSFGSSISPAGDINGDGFDDILVGAHRTGLNRGAAHVFYGATTTPLASDMVSGFEPAKHFAGAVSTAGDVDGDGLDEIIIGAHRDGRLENGKAYLFKYDPSSSVADKASDAVITDFRLYQNFPNPFNPRTTITFSIPVTQVVSISIFDALGREVRTWSSKSWSAGRHDLQWDGSDNKGNPVSSGIYYYRISTASFTSIRKMILIK